MGVNADTAPDVIVGRSHGMNFWELGDPRAYCQHIIDARVTGAADDFIQLILEIGEIKMTMAVGKAQYISQFSSPLNIR